MWASVDKCNVGKCSLGKCSVGKCSVRKCSLSKCSSLLYQLQGVSKRHVPTYRYLIIVGVCDRHSNETVTLRKHVTKYKNVLKWMIEFLRQSESRGDKIVLVNHILITISIVYFRFVRCWGPLGC